MEPPSLGQTSMNSTLNVRPSASLQEAVTQIKSAFKAQVCSLYLYESSSQLLRLLATDGLLPQAVGHTCLRPGEGLAGLVFTHHEVFCTPRAPEHPKFKFIPAIGEEPFQSFIGAPLLSAGGPLGVLVLQYKNERNHSAEEIKKVQESANALIPELGNTSY